MIEPIIAHSITRSTDEAVKLWAFASAQYPTLYPQMINTVANSIIESVSVFALNSRRSLVLLPYNKKFLLSQPRWIWMPYSDNDELILDFRDALNRVIHAKELKVGFESVPNHMSVIENGTVVVPYVKAATDRKRLSYIDLFSLSYAFLYDVLPMINQLSE